VESARFESRLRWSLDVPEELTRAMLPPMVLQPLVENAVKHGIATLPHGGEVQVRAERRGEELLLTVRNPGALEPGSGGGFGLENVEQRLRLGYGPRAALELEAAAGTVTARLRLPLEYAP